MLQRLLASLYRSFDKDPAAQIVIRAQHPQILLWSVAARVLTACNAAGSVLGKLALRGRTLGEVRDWLQGIGCTVSHFSHDFVSIAADTLLEGAGDERESNGDALAAYTSPLWAILDSFAIALDDADASVDGAMGQAHMDLASAEWLDYWGSHFGVERGLQVLLGGGFGDVEDDAAYLARIIKEVLRPRVSKIAIEQAVLELVGEDVDLVEPWRHVFVLNQHELSGSHRLHDGHFWTWNVIEPTMRGANPPRSPAQILRVIERNKPAGTIVKSIFWDRDATHVIANPVASLSDDVAEERHMKSGEVPLGEMILSDNEFTHNWPLNSWSEYGFSIVGALGMNRTDAPPRRWEDGGFWDSDRWAAAKMLVSVSLEVLS